MAESEKPQEPTARILICYHKPWPVVENEVVTPIHLGRALYRPGQTGTDPELERELLAMPGDDSGDNISELNPRFSELTAMYWAWKNYAALGNPDYFGIMHYRRFLDFINSPKELDYHLADMDLLDRGLFSARVVRAAAADYDLCVRAPIAIYRKQGDAFEAVTVQDNYAAVHYLKDLELAYALLLEKYPEYSAEVKEYAASRKHYLCNLFLMRKDLFFYYAKWLFSILFEVDRRIDYSGYSDYQRRGVAFLSERLSGVFYLKMKKRAQVRMKELAFVNVDC